MADGVTISKDAPVTDVAASSLRVVLLLVSGFGTLVGLLQRGQLADVITWFRSTDGASFVSAVVLVATYLYGQYRAHKRAKQVVAVATSAFVPDAIAKLKESAS